MHLAQREPFAAWLRRLTPAPTRGLHAVAVSQNNPCAPSVCAKNSLPTRTYSRPNRRNPQPPTHFRRSGSS